MIRANTLRDLQKRLTAALDAKAGQVASGKLSPAQFVVEAQTLLDYGHARAAILGAARATRNPLHVEQAIQAAARASQSQTQFLLGFARQLAEGKYRPRSQGGLGATQRAARFALYSLRLAGTANDSWLRTMKAAKGVDVEVRWVKHAKESCPDCLFEAGQGWRPAYTLHRVPGEGSTQCKIRCKCQLLTRDGQASYDLGG